MAITLNRAAYDHAAELIRNGLEVEHDENNWQEMQPTRDEAIAYLDSHTLHEYGLWFLGIDSQVDADNKDKFIYPCGDFSVIHKSALVHAHTQAARNGHREVATAAQELLDLIEECAE